jgi:exoribonuclease R
MSKFKVKDNNKQGGGGRGHESTSNATTATSSKKNSKGHGGRPAFYEDYHDDALIASDQELPSHLHQYFVGTIRVNPRKRIEAYLSSSELSVDIRIDTEKNRNRSLDGDLVVVQLLPQSEWLEFSEMMKSKLKMSDSDDEGEGLPIDQLGLKMAALSTQDKNAIEDIQDSLWNPNKEIFSMFSEKETTNDEKSSGSKDEDAERHPVDIASRSNQLQPRGKVVSIIEKKHKNVQVGGIKLQFPTAPGQPLNSRENFLYFECTDNKYQNIYVPRIEFPEALLNNPHEAKKLNWKVRICKDWPKNSRIPHGDNLRALGEMGSIAVETEALLIQNGCDHGPFSEEVIEHLNNKLSAFTTSHTGSNNNNNDTENDKELAVEDGGTSAESDWAIPAEELAKRRDLRDYRIFTIDPPNAKDLDDALHITPLEGGRFEIGVHIADVSFFVDQYSCLDDEARKRSTSVYLVQKVIPMLPSILCEKLCSLNPNVDRLAFSCIWVMNSDGTIAKDVPGFPWFGKTVIRSCAKLDYPTAQRMIEGQMPSEPTPSASDPDGFLKDLSDEVWEQWRRPQGQAAWECVRDVKYMHSIAMKRRNVRLNNGSLVLRNAKLHYKLDQFGNPVEVSSYMIRESNQLVEEYMLMANYLVAQELLIHFKDMAFLRSHGLPDPNGLKDLQEVGTKLGYNIDIESAASLQASLNEISRTAPEETVKIITKMLINPIPEAVYRVAGTIPEVWRHYALCIPYYTHFTSPIRRYSDIVVHRLLEVSIIARTQEPGFLEEYRSQTSFRDELGFTADKCNEMRKAAKLAQQRSDIVFFAIYLAQNNLTLDVPGTVVGIGRGSFTVFVSDYGIDDRLFIDKMHNITPSFDEDSKTLTLYRDSQLEKSETNDNNDKSSSNKGSKSDLPDAIGFTGAVHIQVMSNVRVRLSAKKTPPMNVQMSFIGLAEEET